MRMGVTHTKKVLRLLGSRRQGIHEQLKLQSCSEQKIPKWNPQPTTHTRNPNHKINQFFFLLLFVIVNGNGQHSNKSFDPHLYRYNCDPPNQWFGINYELDCSDACKKIVLASIPVFNFPSRP